MAKLKVKELPKEEQEKILAQMKELQIRGIYTEMAVETANKKIEEALKLKSDAEKQGTEGNTYAAAQNEAQGEENPSGDSQSEPGENDAENANLNAGENEETGENTEEQSDEDLNTGATTEEIAKVESAPVRQEPVKKAIKNKICHICRSAVIDGECTGCGFKLNNGG